MKSIKISFEYLLIFTLPFGVWVIVQKSVVFSKYLKNVLKCLDKKIERKHEKSFKSKYHKSDILRDK